VSCQIINLENVSFKYPHSGKYALNELSLSVNKCEFLAVMGENGAGKTTFCKLINGIIPHLAGGFLTGTIMVDGINTAHSSVPELALKAGMVFDDPDAQIFTSSVKSEAAFGLENILLPPQEIIERVKSALFAVGLGGFEERMPSTLSGGEKQRLSIASVLAMRSDILVLDEPLCRLDPQGVEEVMSVIRDIRTRYNITVIMSSHESGIMAQYADRVCILKNGRIAALDTAENIFADTALLEQNGIEPITIKKEFTTNQTNAHEPINKRDSHKHRTEGPAEAQSFNKVISPLKTFVISVPPEPKVRCLRVNNLFYSYPAGGGIKNINLSIMENDFVAIIGDNGCGKTTLLKTITGLLQPQSGDIEIRGKNTKKLKVSDISKEIGFVMQNPDTQLFCDSVYNEVAFGLKNKRLSKKEIKQRVDSALEIVSLHDAEAYPHAQCRADRTKTVIACVLAMGCKIIIFDEVDVGNDYLGKIKIMNIAKDLHSRGFTIIFVTHNMSLVNEYAQRVIKMDNKTIVFDGEKL